MTLALPKTGMPGAAWHWRSIGGDVLAPLLASDLSIGRVMPVHQRGTHCIAGLTALEKLVLVAPNDGMESDEAQGMPLALSDAALGCLTKLTCLQLQVSSNCQYFITASYHISCCMRLLFVC